MPEQIMWIDRRITTTQWMYFSRRKEEGGEQTATVLPDLTRLKGED